MWLGEGRKGEAPPSWLQTRQGWVDEASLGAEDGSWGVEFPACPRGHTHGRCLLPAGSPSGGLSWKTGVTAPYRISERVQTYFPPLPSGAQPGDPL